MDASDTDELLSVRVSVIAGPETGGIPSAGFCDGTSVFPVQPPASSTTKNSDSDWLDIPQFFPDGEWFVSLSELGSRASSESKACHF
jgi:hypothetical protein